MAHDVTDNRCLFNCLDQRINVLSVPFWMIADRLPEPFCPVYELRGKGAFKSGEPSLICGVYFIDWIGALLP